jgi:AcrR family transcriptional regulator
MTKENIVIAALRLFLTRGYKSVSLVDVANEVNITKGGIYHYFSSKDELLQVALHYLFDRLEANYSALLDNRNTLREVLQALIVEKTPEQYAKDLLGVDGQYSVDCAHFAIEILGKFPDIQQRIETGRVSACEAFARKLETAMEKGEIKSGFDSYALAANIIAMTNGQISLGSQFQSEAMRQRMLDNVWMLLKV